MLRWWPFACGSLLSTTVGFAPAGADARAEVMTDAAAGRDAFARDRVDGGGFGFGGAAAGVRRMRGSAGAGGRSGSALARTAGAGVLATRASDPASGSGGATTSAGGAATTVGGL